VQIAVAMLFVAVGCTDAPRPSEPSSPVASDASDVAVRDLDRGHEWDVLGEAVSRVAAPQVSVATDTAQLREAWAAVSEESLPAIHFERTIVVFYHALVPRGCPSLTLLGLRLDPAERLLYAVFERPNVDRGCSDVAGSHSFVVRIERSSLPSGGVHIRLERRFELCADCGREQEEVMIVP
jgi:hypothetical protein